MGCPSKSHREDPSLAIIAPGATAAEVSSLLLVAQDAILQAGVSRWPQPIIGTITIKIRNEWPDCSKVPEGQLTGWAWLGRAELSCPEAWPHEVLHALGIGDFKHNDPRWSINSAGVATGEFGRWISSALIRYYGRDPWKIVRISPKSG